MTYQCQDCDEIFDEPFKQVEFEKSEFWGEPSFNRTTMLMCVRCGSENLEEVHMCERCYIVKASEGLDYCDDCWKIVEPEQEEMRHGYVDQDQR